MIKLFYIAASLLFGVMLTGVMLEIAVNCGGHYVDSKNIVHVNPCVFIK